MHVVRLIEVDTCPIWGPMPQSEDAIEFKERGKVPQQVATSVNQLTATASAISSGNTEHNASVLASATFHGL